MRIENLYIFYKNDIYCKYSTYIIINIWQLKMKFIHKIFLFISIICTLQATFAETAVTGNVIKKTIYLGIEDDEKVHEFLLDYFKGFFDVWIPITEINKDEDDIIVTASGVFESQKLGVTFKFKTSLEPFMNIIRNNEGVFSDISYNNTATWDESGSRLILDDKEGLNFANLLLKISNNKQISNVKNQIIFNTSLLNGDIGKIILGKYNKNILDVKFEQVDDMLHEGNVVPNILKFKLEYVTQSSKSNHYQFFVILDLDRKYLIFSEKLKDEHALLKPMFAQ